MGHSGAPQPLAWRILCHVLPCLKIGKYAGCALTSSYQFGGQRTFEKGSDRFSEHAVISGDGVGSIHYNGPLDLIWTAGAQGVLCVADEAWLSE
jgi:hypothetical protein